MAISWALTPPSGVESTYDITASTNVRDVSDMLDAVYLKDTPFINKIGWGPPASNTTIEWVTDNLGYGYVIVSNGGTVASNASSFVVGTSNLGAQSLAMRQLNTGTILKYNGQSDKSKGYMVVEDLSIGAGSVVFVYMSGTTANTFSDALTLFIVGNAVPQGSSPRQDTTRPRGLASNYTQIFRQDVRMTGTRTAIEMYAVANELRHQIMLRTGEYKRQLERSALIGHKDAGSATESQTMGGIYDFLRGESGAHIDSTTTTLTDDAINAVCEEIYARGGYPDILVVNQKRARDFKTFEESKIQIRQDSRLTGWYVTQFLTDLGWYMDILISRWLPTNWVMVLSSDQLKLRALRGRKFNLEKLGKKGDYVEWELISEVSLEAKGYNTGKHGMLDAIA